MFSVMLRLMLDQFRRKLEFLFCSVIFVILSLNKKSFEVYRHMSENGINVQHVLHTVGPRWQALNPLLKFSSRYNTTYCLLDHLFYA